MRPLKLKVCGLREAENIADVGKLRPDFVGLIFVPSSPRYVGTSLKPHEISLPDSVKRIGVFRDSDLSTIIESADSFGLHGVQLHGEEDLEYMRALRAALPSTAIIKAVSVNDAATIRALSVKEGLPDLFLLDGKVPGSGSPFDWDLLAHYQASANFLIAGGVGFQDIPRVLTVAAQHPRLIGIDINSRVESAPGIKDIQQIKEVIARLEI
jgi:phosphoribosylanthranilate isomerase